MHSHSLYDDHALRSAYMAVFVRFVAGVGASTRVLRATVLMQVNWKRLQHSKGEECFKLCTSMTYIVVKW